MSAPYFSIARLAGLKAEPVDAALAWLASQVRASGVRQTPELALEAEPTSDQPRLERRALFSCMVERALSIPLNLLGARSLLMIDDEPAVVRALSRVLRQAAPDLTLFSGDGPSDGLAKATALSPDAVLVDAYMPRMSGVEVCARIRGARMPQAVAVLAMTAAPSPELAAAFERAGAIAFLKKPVHAPALLEALSAHLVPNSAGDWE